MKDDFKTYKKTLENYFINISYLYSGDVVSELKDQYIEYIENKNNSAIFINNFLKKVYIDSFKYMFSKVDKEIIIPHQNNIFTGKYAVMENVFAIINEKISFDYNMCFTNYFKYEDVFFLKQVSKYINVNNSKRNKTTKVFYSPSITPYEEDEKGIFYLVDNPIQSFVYIIQNMDYTIEKYKNGYNHIMTYPFYYCDFNVEKIAIVDMKKMVRDKIKIVFS